MVKHRPGGGKSSTVSKTSRSASPGRVNKAKPSNAKATSILSPTSSGAVNPGLLSPVHRPQPRSPIVTRQVAAKSGVLNSDAGASSSNTTPAVIPTYNEFDVLSEDDEDDIPLDSDLQASPVEDQNKTKKVRLPPIHIVDTLFSTVDTLLLDNDISFTMKVSKTSVRVIHTEKTEFEKTLKILKSNNINFFTYDLYENSPVKIVLQGLPLVANASLLRKFARAKLQQPKEVKLLSKAITVTGEHALYLLMFDRGSVKLQDLRKVKFLDGFGVTWRYYTKRPTDAAQCHRCQKFGHGSRNCNLPPKCVKCGESHLTEGCALPRKASLAENDNAKLHKASVKCANCQGNHTANFRGCTARKNYVEALEKSKKKNASNQPSNASKPAPSTTRNPATPPGWGRTYANVAANGNGAPEPEEASNGGLFTLTEFLSLAREMFNRLSSCTTKQQQFYALSELMGKYLYSVI